MVRTGEISKSKTLLISTGFFLALGLMWALDSQAFTLEPSYPLGGAFDRKQAEPWPAEGPHSSNETGVPLWKNLRPQLTDGINEPHPFPEYISRFGRGDRLPEYYRDLLQLPPVDQVQSKVFDEKAIRDIHRIGVFGFENKTIPPFKDETAGVVVANQMFTELRSFPEYTVLSPPQMEELAYKLKIVKTPPTEVHRAPSNPAWETSKDKQIRRLTPKEMDAVMIGAVTKYMDSYIDRRGKLQKSIASGVEFGAFLISTKTGDVVWAARFVGTQPAGLELFNFFKEKSRPAHWLGKKEMSQRAMKKVIKAFYAGQTQKNP